MQEKPEDLEEVREVKLSQTHAYASSCLFVHTFVLDFLVRGDELFFLVLFDVNSVQLVNFEHLTMIAPELKGQCIELLQEQLQEEY